MIDHVTLRVSDFEAAKRFYDAALAPLHYHPLVEYPDETGYGADRADFWVVGAERPTSNAHVAVASRDHAGVDAFYAAAMANGGRDNGPPGPRPDYGEDYYAAYVWDPDGNNIEAVCTASGLELGAGRGEVSI